MRPPIALRIAIASCLLLLTLSGCDRSPRYQIAPAHGSNAQEDRVWVLDTESGRVSLCYEASARIACLPQSEPPGEKAK
jgi:hypothetical protein